MKGADFVRATGVRVLAIVLLLGSVLALAAACGGTSPASPADPPPASVAAPIPSPEVLRTPEPPAPVPMPTVEPTPTATVPEDGLLAYATADGRIQTARPDGSAAKTISPDGGFYSWPGWSPDGRYVVFSGTSPGGNGPGPLALYLYDLEEERRRVLYFNDPGMGPILPTMPHYPLWAPDGQRLSFMASAPLGLSLFISNVGSGDAPQVVLRNSPLYASWSADSRRMLVHAGFDHVLVDVDGGIAARALDTSAISYRAPAWWPSGDRVAFVSQLEAGQSELHISDPDDQDRTVLTSFEGEAAFLWSPDGAGHLPSACPSSRAASFTRAFRFTRRTGPDSQWKSKGRCSPSSGRPTAPCWPM